MRRWGVRYSRREFGKVIAGSAGAAWLTSLEAASPPPLVAIPYRNPIVGTRIYAETARDSKGEPEFDWSRVVAVRDMVVTWESPAERYSTYGHFKGYDSLVDDRDRSME